MSVWPKYAGYFVSHYFISVVLLVANNWWSLGFILVCRKHQIMSQLLHFIHAGPSAYCHCIIWTLSIVITIPTIITSLNMTEFNAEFKHLGRTEIVLCYCAHSNIHIFTLFTDKAIYHFHGFDVHRPVFRFLSILIRLGSPMLKQEGKK